MSESPPNEAVSVEDIRAYEWASTIAAVTPRQCRAYSSAFHLKAEELDQAGDKRGSRVFTLLATVTGLPLTLDSSEGGLGRAVGRFTPVEFDALASVFPEVTDAELQARIGDVLWQGRKDYRSLARTVEAYLASALNLEDASWSPCFQRYERAMQLGAKFGLGKPLHQRVVVGVEEAIQRHEASETGLLCERLMGLLLAYRAGEPGRYSTLAGAIAARLVTAGQLSFARDYFESKAAWDHRAGDEPAAAAARLAAAETYVSEAEALAVQPKPSFMNVTHWMTKGVLALRQAAADPRRIEAAHRQLLQYELRQTEEMHPFTDSEAEMEDEIPDLSEPKRRATETARAAVRGRSLPEAILQLGRAVTRPVDPAGLRKRVEASVKDFPINHLMATTMLNEAGRVKGIKPAISPWDPEQTEEALSKEMFHQAMQIDWPLAVDWQINPARLQIESEHPLRLRDLSFLVAHNPFVPHGREGIFLRGLHAGFQGDFLLSTHLLIPQLENSIRTILDAKGVITSKLDKGVQDERLLGWLLNHPRTAEVFGSAVVFNLRGLLVERFGYNLRNDMSHGLMSEGGFYSVAAVYVWWMTLRLCVISPRN